jgi:pimeloyl-ACP methyl ester carboxylesterase
VTEPDAGGRLLRLGDGRQLQHEELGDPAGTPVVLFHGAPGSRLFAPPSGLAAEAGVRLITFDRPGYGGSDRREGRELLDTAGDVGVLADALAVDRFSALGVSAGGGHALACAVALGARVTSVGVASMPGPLDEVPGGWDALDRRQRPAAEMAREDPAVAAGWVVRYMGRWTDDPTSFLGGGTPADRELLAEAAAGRMLRADVAEALAPGAGGMADDLVALWRSWGFRIAEVPRGVLIWHGAQDTRGEPDFRYLAATLPGCRSMIWPHAGHYGVADHWREVLADLTAS